jgi:hypothetical protein
MRSAPLASIICLLRLLLLLRLHLHLLCCLQFLCHITAFLALSHECRFPAT